MSLPLARFTGALLGLAVAASAADTVMSPAKRQQALEHAKAFVAPREIVAVNVDPFYPAAFTEAVAAVGRVSNVPTPAAGTPGAPGTPTAPAGPRSDRELLQAIAATLKPGGAMTLPGGVQSLSFGQKRVKAGSVLTITFEGNQYTVEIVSIDRTNFTLRLNREEFTRSIK